MKIAIGLLISVCVGIGCRWFGIPLPGPPAIMGAAMAVAMATGYTATDMLLSPRSSSAAPTEKNLVDPAGAHSEAKLETKTHEAA